MALTVTRARVKERCAIADTAYDTPIDNIISDYVPAIEFAVRQEYVADTGNTGLQATLNLAALEICCGEFIAQRCREPGYADSLELDGLSLSPLLQKSARDPSGLVAAGWARLLPFLKVGVEVGPVSGVRSTLREDAS